MPDNFNAYKDNLAPGCTDAQIEEYYGGYDEVGDEEPIMNDMLRVDVADGKYTVVQDHTGRLTALRYGQPWRDCVGDGLILALAYELEEARAQLVKIPTATNETKTNQTN